jgi:uncharacterized protein (TIGR03083 family)
MPDALSVLRSSVDQLSARVGPLGDEQLVHPAYPSAWSIADVLSHVGSSGVIMGRRLDDALAGSAMPEEFSEGVWAEWDAKSPRAKVDDGLAVDEAFTARLESVGPDDRSTVSVPFGPFTFDWDGFIRTRLNEHVVHGWDVAVALDSSATLAADGVRYVIDNLELIGRYTAQPVAPDRTVTVATSAPERGFAVTIAATTAEFASTDIVPNPTLRMPSEAFIRLVYGRLDVDHTPASVEGDADALEQLRQVFPGPELRAVPAFSAGRPHRVAARQGDEAVDGLGVPLDIDHRPECGLPRRLHARL